MLTLPREAEAQFREWAHRQGEAVAQDVESLLKHPRRWRGGDYARLFLKANALIQPLMRELSETDNGGLEYLLLLAKTMIALVHVNAGRPYVWEEVRSRSLLQDAITLYDLEVVSLEVAARIAGVSQSEFIAALGPAGVSVFQYTAEDVLEELRAA